MFNCAKLGKSNTEVGNRSENRLSNHLLALQNPWQEFPPRVALRTTGAKCGVSKPPLFSTRPRLYTDGGGGGAADKKLEKRDRFMGVLLKQTLVEQTKL